MTKHDGWCKEEQSVIQLLYEDALRQQEQMKSTVATKAKEKRQLLYAHTSIKYILSIKKISSNISMNIVG